MTNLLIAVHGIGAYAPQWSTRILDKLDSVARQYSAFQGEAPAFRENFVFEEVMYDSVFDRLVRTWREQADAFDAFRQAKGSLLPQGSWSKLFDWLTDTTLPDDEKAVFWSTLLDAVLYRGFPIVRDEVRATAMAQMVRHMTDNMGEGAVNVSILAHSLGTAVTHDVLQLLASGGAGGNRAFEAREWKFDHLFMLADVAMLGPPGLIDMKPGDAGYLVKPKSAVPVGSGPETYYCNRFHSFRHEFDPIVRWAPLDPARFNADWGVDFRSPAPFTQIKAANVHGFTHYLDHPSVHVPIINAMMGFSAVDSQEERDAVAAYPPLGSPQCSAAVESLKRFVRGLPESGGDMSDIAINGSRFFVEARRAADACRAIGGSLDD